MNAPSAPTITLLILLPLLGWRVYMRFKRMVGRQHLTKVRPWVTVTLFPALLVLLAYFSSLHLERLGMLAAGVAAGAALGMFGLSKTKFEATPGGLFYTPNAHLGIALSLLFAGRVAYRLVTVMVLNQGTPPPSNDFARSPLTLAIFGLLAGYYVTYAVGLLRWRSRVRSGGQTAAQEESGS
jgi:hypothetical protein